MKFESIKNNSKLQKFAKDGVKNLYSIKGGYMQPTKNATGVDHIEVTGASGTDIGDYGGGTCG